MNEINYSLSKVPGFSLVQQIFGFIDLSEYENLIFENLNCDEKLKQLLWTAVCIFCLDLELSNASDSLMMIELEISEKEDLILEDFQFEINQLFLKFYSCNFNEYKEPNSTFLESQVSSRLLLDNKILIIKNREMLTKCLKAIFAQKSEYFKPRLKRKKKKEKRKKKKGSNGPR